MNGSIPVLRRAPLTCGVVCWLWLMAATIFAAEPIIITSVSKQFVVRGQPQRSMFAAHSKEDFAYLDPATLAVTCERVKRAVAHELGWDERWRGTIYVNIRPVRRDGEQPDIIAFRTERGWSYRIDLPDEISRRHLLEALVETLVLEFADRSATNDSVELPPWLVEGLTAHLSEGPLAGVALQARSLQQISGESNFRASRTTRQIDVDQALRARVKTLGGMSIDQLNWPEFTENDPAATEAYHHASHLLVRELLRLRGGPDALCATLALLPAHLNWQTAFLRGFEPHFKRMLDVEKWWSITLSQWKAHEISVFWSESEARQKLEEILYTPMEVRLANDTVPHVTPVALQTVLNDWEFSQQAALLQTKLDQLRLVRLHCTSNLTSLLDGYHAVLTKYLEARSNPGRVFTERKARKALTQAIAELNLLDQQRARMTAPVPLNNFANADVPHDPDGNARTRAKPLSAWSEPRPVLGPSPLSTQ
jgi:hypothetical protein